MLESGDRRSWAERGAGRPYPGNQVAEDRRAFPTLVAIIPRVTTGLDPEGQKQSIDCKNWPAWGTTWRGLGLLRQPLETERPLGEWAGTLLFLPEQGCVHTLASAANLGTAG